MPAPMMMTLGPPAEAREAHCATTATSTRTMAVKGGTPQCTIKFDCQLTDRGRMTDLEQDTANNNSKILQQPLLALFRQLVPKGFYERVLVEETQLLLEKLTKSNPVVI